MGHRPSSVTTVEVPAGPVAVLDLHPWGYRPSRRERRNGLASMCRQLANDRLQILFGSFYVDTDALADEIRELTAKLDAALRLIVALLQLARLAANESERLNPAPVTDLALPEPPSVASQPDLATAPPALHATLSSAVLSAVAA